MWDHTQFVVSIHLLNLYKIQITNGWNLNASLYNILEQRQIILFSAKKQLEIEKKNIFGK